MERSITIGEGKKPFPKTSEAVHRITLASLEGKEEQSRGSTDIVRISGVLNNRRIRTLESRASDDMSATFSVLNDTVREAKDDIIDHFEHKFGKVEAAITALDEKINSIQESIGEVKLKVEASGDDHIE